MLFEYELFKRYFIERVLFHFFKKKLIMIFFELDEHFVKTTILKSI